MTRRAANVYAIAPGAPFLKTLVRAVRDGGLGFPAPDPRDPLALAAITIYVPTRRAARALRSEFAETSGTSSAVLPVIRPLGDFDEDTGFFLDGPETLALKPPIAPDERLLTLARLTRAWTGSMAEDAASMIAGETVAVPRTAADAVWLAKDLAHVMDELAREGVSWDGIKDVDAEGLSAWWQLTRKFLEIASAGFLAHLEERSLSDPVQYRNAAIRAETAQLAATPLAGPVIAAGSTGSVPATAELLALIARLHGGAVILPGLDRGMDETAWNLIGENEKSPTSFSHPQYGLKKLLARFGLRRTDVPFLGEVSTPLRAREQIISDVLLPAESTEGWALSKTAAPETEIAQALTGINLIEAPSEREEALAIAIALRAAIDGKREKTAALVTVDRSLARRVSAELLRFGIQADDSGGRQLANSPQAALFRSILQCVFEPGDPVAILSVLKHPLALFSREKAEAAQAARTLELIALRGVIGTISALTLTERFEKSLRDAASAERRPSWDKRVRDEHLEGARSLASALRAALLPLAQLAQTPGGLSVSETVAACATAFEAIGRAQDGSLQYLYSGDSGEEFAAHLRGLVAVEAGFDFAPADWPSIHAALISGKMVKPKSGSDPNIFIWGTLEARLQHVDTLVLGGLNETVWPARPPDDPFLSRGMKSGLGLEPSERRTGQAAHDFQMGLGAQTVILTRSARMEGAPTVASRWLQRLTAYAGKQQTKAMTQRGAQYLQWAHDIDSLPNIDLEKRPEPSPPLELRPRHFSITEIATLRGDPYAIYAKRILKLLPLDPLIREADERERGTLFHEIMARFIAQKGQVADAQTAEVVLRKIALDAFTEQQYSPEVVALWFPRFEELIERIVYVERLRGDDIKASHTEVSAAKTAIPNSIVTLSGRADRIDERLDGTIDIIDYKTGGEPTAAQGRTLINPQLALEAALARQGSFKGLGAASIHDLVYCRLKSKGELKFDSLVLDKNGVFKEGCSAEDLADKSWRELTRLVGKFAQPQAKYDSHALQPKRDGDYDHLARVLEWSAGSDGGEAVPDE
jgi:ATP-dependent helicase/nuclease subunit B